MHDIFQFPKNAAVLQDKGTPSRTYKASGQLAYATPPANPRPKHHGSQKRRVVEISGCVERHIAERVEQMREQGGGVKLSRSKVVGSLITMGVQHDADIKYGKMLKPIIENTIGRKFDSYSNRLAYLSAQAYYAAKTAEIIQCKILSYVLGNDQDLCNHYIAEARKQARASLSRHIEEK
jgi:hypothetical protein